MFEAITISSSVPLSIIEESAKNSHVEFTKAVIDLEKKIMVIGMEMHSDEEEILNDSGSEQKNLWGINLYPEYFKTENFIEFDSMINVRPRENRSRYVEDSDIRKKIIELVDSLIIK